MQKKQIQNNSLINISTTEKSSTLCRNIGFFMAPLPANKSSCVSNVTYGRTCVKIQNNANISLRGQTIICHLQLKKILHLSHL